MKPTDIPFHDSIVFQAKPFQGLVYDRFPILVNLSMAQESEQIDGFQFVWVTDGGGWKSARNNLRETFEIMDTIYNLAELEDGAFERLFS